MDRNWKEKLPYNEEGERISLTVSGETVYMPNDLTLVEYLNNFKVSGIPDNLKGIESIKSYFKTFPPQVTSTSSLITYESLTNTDGWSENSPACTNENPNLWRKEIIKYSNGYTEDPVYYFCGSLGSPGIDGASVEWIFKLTSQYDSTIVNNLKSEIDNFNSNNLNSVTDDQYPSGWTDDPLETSETNPYLFYSKRKKILQTNRRVWSNFSEPKLFTKYPKAGDIIYPNNVYAEELYKDDFDSSDVIFDGGEISELPEHWFDNIDSSLTGVIYQRTIFYKVVDGVGIFVDVSNPVRITGMEGIPGSDGNNIEFIYCGSVTNLIGLLPPFPNTFKNISNSNTSQWLDNASDCSINGVSINYLFAAYRIGHYTSDDDWEWDGKDNTWYNNATADEIAAWNYGWQDPFTWASWGKDGVDGDGVQYVFLRITQEEYDWVLEQGGWSKIPLENKSSEETESQSEEVAKAKGVDYTDEEFKLLKLEQYPICTINDNIRYWADDPCKDDGDNDETDCTGELDAEHPYIFCSKRLFGYLKSDYNEGALNSTATKSWGPWSTPKLWSHYGQDAVSYRLNLENSNEFIYYIEQSTRFGNAVVIDEDGITTGRITLNDADAKGEKISIDEFEISTVNGTFRTFTNAANNEITLDAGDGWKCTFKIFALSEDDSEIKLIKIGDGDKITSYDDIFTGAYKPSSSDSVFTTVLTKFQKKFVIRATNKEKGILRQTTWTINSIHDKNGDGTFRYAISSNISRIVKTDTYIKDDSNNLSKQSTLYNVTDAFPIKFNVNCDSYGINWKEYQGPVQIKILNESGGTELALTITTKTNGNYQLNLTTAQQLVNNIIGSNPESTSSLIKIELHVIDPDYDPDFTGDLASIDAFKQGNYNKYSKVDEMTIYLDYIKIVNGKDGEKGGDGVGASAEDVLAAMKTISCDNDNIILIPGLTYILNFYNASGNLVNVTASSGNRDGYRITPNYSSSHTILADSSISRGSFSDTITFIPEDTEKYNNATVIVNYIGDLNNDGEYYNYEIKASPLVIGTDSTGKYTTNTVTVNFVKTKHEFGKAGIPLSVSGYYTLNNNTNHVAVSGTKTINISDYTSGNTSVTIEWWAQDPDFAEASSDIVESRRINELIYYRVDQETINLVPATTITNNHAAETYNYLGQACRIRNIKSLTGNETFFPVGVKATQSYGDDTIKDEKTDSWIPKYYDVVSVYTNPGDSNGGKTLDEIKNGYVTYYLRKNTIKTTTTSNPLTLDELINSDATNWSSTEMKNFMAVDTLIANQISAKKVEADKVLVKDDLGDSTYVAGMLNGYDSVNDKSTSNVRIFAGSTASGLEKTPFNVTNDGTVSISGGSLYIWGNDSDRIITAPNSCIKFGIATLNEVNKGISSRVGDPFIAMYDSDGNLISGYGNSGNYTENVVYAGGYSEIPYTTIGSINFGTFKYDDNGIKYTVNILSAKGFAYASLLSRASDSLDTNLFEGIDGTDWYVNGEGTIRDVVSHASTFDILSSINYGSQHYYVYTPLKKYVYKYDGGWKWKEDDTTYRDPFHNWEDKNLSKIPVEMQSVTYKPITTPNLCYRVNPYIGIIERTFDGTTVNFDNMTIIREGPSLGLDNVTFANLNLYDKIKGDYKNPKTFTIIENGTETNYIY